MRPRGTVLTSDGQPVVGLCNKLITNGCVVVN